MESATTERKRIDEEHTHTQKKIEMRTCNKRLKMMENVTFSIVITFDCVIYVHIMCI